MDLLSLVRLLVRRWRVAVPAALLTVVGVVAVVHASAPQYRSTGSIVLLSPPEPPKVDSASESSPTAADQNPYARFGDLAIMTDILARIGGDESTRAELARQGVSNYEVSANRLTRGPVIEATGEEENPEAAIRSAETVLTEIQAILADLQQAEGIDPNYFITSVSVQPPSTASAVYGSTVRAAIGALAVGGLCTLGLGALAEVVAQRRAARRTASPSGLVASDALSPGVEAGGSNGSPTGGNVATEAARPDAGAPGSNGSATRRSAAVTFERPVDRVVSPQEASIGSPADEDRA
jgi:hypothetical protein